jgi:hypothetical protein
LLNQHRTHLKSWKKAKRDYISFAFFSLGTYNE